MWVEIISFFLGISLLLYCLLGGADFGAGILELFPSQQNGQKKLVSHAMGPVWEANHMWLVMAVVILFNGFPRAYSNISITYHIPLTMMLIGIILRGCSFTFRSYDVAQSNSQKYYSIIFSASSLITPFFLGMIAGGILLGRQTGLELGYYDRYFSPWLNIFSCSTGIFLCCLFTFLASVYLIGEAKVTQDRGLGSLFIRRAQMSNGVTIIVGILVFVSAELSGLNLVTRFAGDRASLFCMGIATFLMYPLWKSLRLQQVFRARIYAAALVTCVLLGWFKIQFPILGREVDSNTILTLYNSAAPEPTLKFLLYALMGGSMLIFPALYFLFRIYKFQK